MRASNVSVQIFTWLAKSSSVEKTHWVLHRKGGKDCDRQQQDAIRLGRRGSGGQGR